MEESDDAILDRLRARQNQPVPNVSESDGRPGWSLLPKEIGLIILSLLDRAGALQARSVCRSWERLLYHLVPLVLDLRDPFDARQVHRLLHIFPKTTLFVLPSDLGFMTEEDVQSLSERQAVFRWDKVNLEQYLNIVEILDQAKAWKYIDAAIATWIPMLLSSPAGATRDSALINFLYNSRGSVLHTLGKYEDALACYQALARRVPQSAVARNDCGFVLQLLHRHRESLVYFDQAVELAKARSELELLLSLLSQPTDVFFHNRALSYAQCGDFVKALEDASQVQSPSISTQRMTAQILKNLGRIKEAMDTYDHALEVDEIDCTTLNDLACAHLDAMNYERALSLFDKALIYEPSDSNLVYNRGRVLLEMSRIAEALEAFTRSLKLNPRDPAAFYRRAKCYQLLGQEANARADYMQVLELPAEQGCDWNARGHALLTVNRGLEAYDCFQRALVTRPFAAEYLFGRAKAHLFRGMIEDAWADISKAVDLKPLPEYVDAKNALSETRRQRKMSS